MILSRILGLIMSDEFRTIAGYLPRDVLLMTVRWVDGFDQAVREFFQVMLQMLRCALWKHISVGYSGTQWDD